MSGPRNNHRQPVMDQDYLVEGIFTPIKVASRLSLETVIKMGALDAFVPVATNRYKIVSRRADKPELIVDAEGSVWMRSGNRDMFIRVAADEPPTPEEKEDREEEDEDDLSAGFDETFGEEADAEEDKYPHREDDGLPDMTEPEPNADIPGTVDNPTREMNGEPVPPPEQNSIHMTDIGPAHSNDVMVFQTYMPGQTPKPTLKERVTEHAQEGAELRDELCELVGDVQEVIELAQGTGVEEQPADELTVVLSTPTYKNPLVQEQSNDPMSPTFAQYGSQKQAVDDEGPEDYPPDSEQAARDAARHAFAETMSTTGDTDRAHDAAYEAAFQALTPFIQDVGKAEELAQAIMSDMQTNPKNAKLQKQADDVADPDYDYDQMTGTGGHAPYEPDANVHADAELNVDEKLNLVLRELEEVEEAVGVNESPEEEATEENEALPKEATAEAKSYLEHLQTQLDTAEADGDAEYVDKLKRKIRTVQTELYPQVQKLDKVRNKAASEDAEPGEEFAESQADEPAAETSEYAAEFAGVKDEESYEEAASDVIDDMQEHIEHIEDGLEALEDAETKLEAPMHEDK